jgi:hypothetical protein
MAGKHQLTRINNTRNIVFHGQTQIVCCYVNGVLMDHYLLPEFIAEHRIDK